MTRVTEQEKDRFFKDVEAAAKKAVWCALATVSDGEPRVRMVHPTWEGSTLWLATDPGSPKAQIRENGAVDLQFQVAPDDFVHLMVRGRATVLDDQETKTRVWDVLDYDLSQFFPNGPTDPGYCVVRIDPERVELSEMFGMSNKRVWKA